MLRTVGYTGRLYYFFIRVIFTTRLVSLQKKIVQLYRKAETEFNHSLYHATLKQRETWGLKALLAPLAALEMLVLKVPAQAGFLKRFVIIATPKFIA